MTEEHKRKISEAHKALGERHWSKRPEVRAKMRKAQLGKKMSDTMRKKMKELSLKRTGESASHWLGDKVGKVGIHLWLRKKYGTPNKCDHCRTVDKSKNYDWASKDHKYIRDRKAFMRLCRSCHRKYDYKLRKKLLAKE